MRKTAVLPALILAVAAPALAQVQLASADQAAAFRAAEYKRVGTQWRACDDPGTDSYSPGQIDEVRDLNGDGRPEALISESSTFCYGNTGVGYAVVSKQTNGGWKLVTSGIGIVTVLTSKGVGGWPDLEIGGPGFCYPVERWNGTEYKLLRHQYEGKACRPAS